MANSNHLFILVSIDIDKILLEAYIKTVASEVEPRNNKPEEVKWGTNHHGEKALSANDYFKQLDIIFPDDTPSSTGEPFVSKVLGRERLKTGHRGFLKNADQEIEGLIPQSPPSFSEASQR